MPGSAEAPQLAFLESALATGWAPGTVQCVSEPQDLGKQKAQHAQWDDPGLKPQFPTWLSSEIKP